MSLLSRWAGLIAIGALLAPAIGCAATVGTADSPETRAEIAGELARLSVETGTLERALDSGADLAWGASAETLQLELGRQLTAQEEGRVRDILRVALREFLTPQLWEETISRVYAAHFTAAELDSILAFYGSPAGRKVLELEGVLGNEVDEGLEGPLEEKLDAFIARVDEELGAAFEGLDS